MVLLMSTLIVQVQGQQAEAQEAPAEEEAEEGEQEHPPALRKGKTLKVRVPCLRATHPSGLLSACALSQPLLLAKHVM